MKVDEIIEIGIDKLERLYLKPKNEAFPLIYRTATEVHCDLILNEKTIFKNINSELKEAILKV